MAITSTDDDDDYDDADDESATGDFLQSYLSNLQDIEDDDDDDDDASATKPFETIIPQQQQHQWFAKNNATTTAVRTLEELMQILPTCANVHDVQSILASTMGTMALCRGEHGKKLHQAGAVTALSQLLYRMHKDGKYNDNNDDRLRLLLPILAAIRDLSCGNPTIRADFHHLLPDLTELLLHRNNGEEEDDDAKAGNDSGVVSSLPFQTALVGTIRNLAHSNGRNGRRLHELGVTTWLVSYLLQHNNAPPPPSSPDRELYFRTVGTILAIVEKVDAAIPMAMAVTEQCLMDESSSSSSSKAASKLYHPGLLKLIRSSHEQQPQNRYATLLHQEVQRQAAARLREEQRRRTNDR
jgi:hypothetical protein